MKKWIPLLLALTPSEVLSQKINVRSGAHDGFTRLVLDAPSDTFWTLQHTTNGAKLILQNHSEGFDISRIFDRIDNTHISKVTSTSSELSLQFSCLCVANAFKANPTLIAVDISSKISDPAAKFPTVYNSNFQGSVSLSYESQATDKTKTMPKSHALKPYPEIKTFTASGENHFSNMEYLNDQRILYDINPYKNSEINLTKEFRKSIAIAPFINRKSPSSDRYSGEKLPLKRKIEGSENYQTKKYNNSLTSQGNVQITLHSKEFLQNNGTEEMDCVNSNLLNFQDWDFESDMISEVTHLSRYIYSESGRVNPKQVSRLAQAYLNYGFGAEAIVIISLSNDLQRKDYALLGLANIIEHGHDKNNILSNILKDCDDDSSLWKILSSFNSNTLSEATIDSALFALNNLPVKLRRILAPQLSQRFLNAGSHEASAAALRIIELSEGNKSSATNLEMAKLYMKRGQPKLARKQLLEIVSANTTQSATALAHLVRFLIDEEDEIDGRTGLLIGAFATELRGDPIAGDLSRTHVLALAKSGNFSEAFNVLANEKIRYSIEAYAELRSELLNFLTWHEDDITFLQYATGHMGLSQSEISKETLLILAKRFLDLGFPSLSDEIFPQETEGNNLPEYSTIKLQTDLELSRPHTALAFLSKTEGEVSARLRAEVEMQSGNFTDAHLAYRNLDDLPNSQYAAWLSTEWSALIEEETPVFGVFAKMAKEKLGISPQERNFLNAAETALQESTDSREQVISTLKLVE
jgi:hypothetical protein